MGKIHTLGGAHHILWCLTLQACNGNNHKCYDSRTLATSMGQTALLSSQINDLTPGWCYCAFDVKSAGNVAAASAMQWLAIGLHSNHSLGS